MLGSSVRVKTVAVYLRVSTQLAQRQASTPVRPRPVAPQIGRALMALGSPAPGSYLFILVKSPLRNQRRLQLFNNAYCIV